MASNRSLPASKTKTVVCGYCNESLLHQNFTTHNERKHPGQTAHIAGETKITGFFNAKSKKRKTQDSEYECGSREHVAENDQLPSEQTKSSTTTSSTLNDSKLDELLERVKDIQISISTENKKKPVLPPIATPQDIAPADERIKQMQVFRSIKEIVECFTEFEYKNEEYIMCKLCVPLTYKVDVSSNSCENGIFMYNAKGGLSFSNESKLPKCFTNLKKNLKEHLSNKTHTTNLTAWEERLEEDKRNFNRNRQIGLRIARICYVIYKEGRSERSFETEVARKIQDGLDMGDINHSHTFPGKFRPYVAHEVHIRMQRFLTSRLNQTGFFPPLNIGADKGTSKHRTRQFITAVTVVPDSPNLLQPVYIGQPVVKDHTGPGVSTSIKAGLDKFGIVGNQIEGSSHDGQYYHLSVPEGLKELYNLNQFISTPDPLHRAGTVDVHIRKDESFEWMNTVFGICKDLYKKFNWGKNYELMVETCEEIDRNMAQLANFQTTRFANSVRFVVINVRKDFETLVHCLVKIQNDLRNSSVNKDQEKFRDAGRLHNSIKNKKFCMTLSGLTDVYDQFGCFVNIVQKVDILPHERYDLAMRVLDKMTKMKNEISSHESCVVQNGICLWPNYHSDLVQLIENGNYQNEKIEKDRPMRMYQTRLAVVAETADIEKDPLKQAEDNLRILITRLEKDLRKEVFSEETVVMIEKIRFLTDLRSLAKQLMEKGHIFFGATNEKQFLSNVRDVTATLNAIPDSKIKENYQLFLKKFENYLKGKDFKNGHFNEFAAGFDIIRFKTVRRYRIDSTSTSVCISKGFS